MYGKKARYLKKDPKQWKPVAKKVEAAPAPVVKDFCGGKRTVVQNNEPRWYPAEDAPRRHQAKKAAPKITKLRSTITPGTVLILLAGRFEGKRVVFLKQLESGLLLVTGPYKINGVPIRRVNQAYVIATSTKVDLGNYQVPAKFNDDYFKHKKADKKKKSEFFTEDKKEKTQLPAERVADQKTVDADIVKAVKNTPLLREYLSARFSLTNGQFPHALKF